MTTPTPSKENELGINPSYVALDAMDADIAEPPRVTVDDSVMVNSEDGLPRVPESRDER
ncbi:MAG: hypothetical protein WC757_02650 [Candidatus Paceibacterota bacterium]